jgi:hypothetical protein
MRNGPAGSDSTTGERMRSGSRLFSALLSAGLFLAPALFHAQEQSSGATMTVPQIAGYDQAPAGQQTPAPQSTPAPDAQQPASGSTPPAAGPAQSTPAQTPATPGTSSSQAPATQADAEKSKREKAEEQLHEQEKQRVLGVVPSFNISYRSDAVSLTAAEKMKLAFRSATDPVAFGVAFVVAGGHEALDEDPGFGWGIEGYGKRSGAAYLDAFDGTMIGNGILPSIFHQDPRYFRLGHGTTIHRLLYAISTSYICKHDNSGRWEPNYSNIAGNIISGAISVYYYPPSNSDIGQTITNGMIVTTEGTFGGVFQEFWPDISRRVFHKDPTHGLDAQARAQDAQEKQARKEAKEKQQQEKQQDAPK